MRTKEKDGKKRRKERRKEKKERRKEEKKKRKKEKEKERKEGWCVGIGYIIGDKSNKAEFITGKETIPVEALTETALMKNKSTNV